MAYIKETKSDLVPGSLVAEGVGKWYSLATAQAGTEDEDIYDEGGVDEMAGDDTGWNELAFQWKRLRNLNIRKWAVQSIDLDVKPGDRIGILGPNGSGKSTLVNILAGIIPPSEGSVRGAGRVLPWWAIRQPIDRMRSGRVNVRMIAELLRYPSHEIDAAMDRIEGIANIGEYFDARVTTYSRGMFGRIGAAIAVSLPSDIVIVDDTYILGDERFKRQMQNAFVEFIREGRTLILASNNIAQLRQFCQRGILLEDGKVRVNSDISSAIRTFLTIDAPNIFHDGLMDNESETDWVDDLSEHSELHPIENWHQQNIKAAQPWEKAIQEQVATRHSAPNLGQITTFSSGSFGSMSLFRLVDTNEHILDEILPGEDFFVLINFDINVPKTSVQIRLEIEAESVLVLVAEPTFPFLFQESGSYLVRCKVDGMLFGNNFDMQELKVRARSYLKSADHEGTPQYVAGTSRLSVRGDIRQSFDAKLQEHGLPESCVLSPAPATIGEQLASIGGVLPEVTTPLLDQAGYLARKPALRPRLEWKVFRLGSNKTSKNEASTRAS